MNRVLVPDMFKQIKAAVEGVGFRFHGLRSRMRIQSTSKISRSVSD